MIDPEQVRELFDAASDMPASGRGAFLARECRGRPDLLAQVQALLASEERAEAAGFLHQPALHAIARQEALHLPEESRTGELFGRYRIVRLLGEGGMGEVYLAEDTELARKVALKIVKNGVRTNRLLDSFDREGRILAHLNHENIARLLDAGTSAAGVPYLVMEYVDGKPITEHCDVSGLSIDDRLELFRVVCSAVQYAHQNVVVHRDLKPGNIMVTAGGQVKLLDFGIAKLLDSTVPAEAGTTMLPALTPEYASPEQARGEPTTTATDIYSLGVVLYELLTGAGLFERKDRTSGEVLKAICDQDPPAPSAAVPSPRLSQLEGGAAKLQRRLSGDLDQIVLKALRKEPEARYPTVEQFSADIGRQLAGLPVMARHGTLSYRAAKFVRRNRVAAIAGAIAAVTLITGVAAITWEARVAIARGVTAQRRFEEARKLAHAILFDYHDSIARLPGSTLARRKLVTDALTYLNAISAESTDDAGLRMELAAAYLRVGDVQGRPYTPNLGQTDEALVSYRKAAAILAPMARAGIGDARRQLANGYERIGTIQLRKFQFADALASQQIALEIREELGRRSPGDEGLRGEVAVSRLDWGDALQAICFDNQRNVVDCLQRALESQRQALQSLEELSARNADDTDLRRHMAEAHQKIGFRLRDMSRHSHDDGLLRQALDSQRKAMEIRDEIAAANPADSRDRRSRTDQKMLLADAQLTAGDLPTALEGYRSALAEFEALYAADPVNAEARRDVSFSSFKLAQALVQAGDIAAGFRYYGQSLGLAKQLLAEDPNNAEDRQQVAGVYLKQSEAAERSGDAVRAAGYYANFAELTPLTAAISYQMGELDLRAVQATKTPDAVRGKYRADAQTWLGRCLAELRARGGSHPPAEADRAFWNIVTQDLAQAETALAPPAVRKGN
ncbi:MAG TPA: protein kinase [Bryobacteraceae bacterium]|jgi:non-specific serine/threonine protein kinase/serine/threonine-protein kinase|nr:protein kinase [Bryobacteraceae bacterium]